MWVFDGEQWHEEGANPQPEMPAVPEAIPYELLELDLELVEVRTTEEEKMPPFPLF